MDRRTALSGLLTLGAGSLAPEVRVSSSAEPHSRWARYFPNVVLHTQDGQAVRFYDDLVKDKVVAINFMYTRCADGLCPQQTANLARLQDLLGDRLGRSVFLYSITLSPHHDTPKVLKKYAGLFGARPGWTFLTGERRDIELLRRRLGFYDRDPKVDRDKSQHIGMLRYGNDAFNWWSSCPCMSKPEQIARFIGWIATPRRPLMA